MKKAKWLVVLGLVLVFGFIGCSKSSSSEEDGVIEISFGHIQNPGHSLYIAAEDFKNRVHEKTGGKVKVNIFPSSQLGSAREMMEQTTIGTLDMTFAATSDWAIGLNIPELSVFELPFLYSSLDDQKKAIEDILPNEINNMLGSSKVRLLFTFSNGIRDSLLKYKPINTLEDIKGLKMRTPESVLSVSTWKNLGAVNVVSPWSEVYTVLQQGVSDAIEADAVGMVNMNLQEVGEFYSKTAHQGNIYITCISKDKWASIPEELQVLIEEAGFESMQKQIAGRKAQDEEALGVLAAAGVVINDVPQSERDKMREAEKPIYDEYIEKYGLGDLIEKLLNI